MPGTLDRKQRRLIIRILRVILFTILGLFLLLLLVTGYLYIDRDNISRRMLMSASELTRGDLYFSDIAFNPFVHFPSISVLIREAEFYENPLDQRNQNEQPILKIERLYASIDILELLRDRIEVSKITIEEGEFRLIAYPDSSINVMNAIVRPREDEEEPVSPTPVTLTTVSEEASEKPDTLKIELEINLDQVILEDIRLHVDNRVERNDMILDFERLNASFGYSPESIRTRLVSKIDVVSVSLGGIERIADSRLDIESSLTYEQEEMILRLDPSILMLNTAVLNLEGEMGFRDTGFIDLDFSGSENDFVLLRMILSETGVQNLKEGDVYFEGSLSDNDLRGMPVLDVTFGLRDVRLNVPGTSKDIRELNLSGRMNSGGKNDLSEAWVKIDTLHAILPEGFIHGSVTLRNAQDPELDFMFNARANTAGLDQVFRIGFVDSLSGQIEVNIAAVGARWYSDSGYVNVDKIRADLILDSASMVFPGVMNIQYLNGSIHHTRGRMIISDMEAVVDDSDFLVNGYITHPFYLVFNVDTLIEAGLQVRSDMFDLPGFLDFVPEVREAFPYRIKDADLDVRITTTTEKFLEMRPSPTMTFEISHLEGEIEDLLPPLTMDRGVFELAHKSGRTWLGFNDFRIDMLGAKLEADVEFNSPAKKRDYLLLDVSVDDLNPGRLIRGEETDSIPAFLDGLLSADFLLDLHFPHDTLQTLKKIDLRDADIYFANQRDTIQTNSLEILAEDIYVDAEKDPNPFATLTTDIRFRSDRSRYNRFNWIAYNFDIQAREGIYRIVPSKSRLFGKEGSGLYVLDPFAEVPSYSVRYQVEQYEVMELMEKFIKDTLIVGTMDFLMDVSIEIHEDQKALAGLNGELVLQGDDLTFYGIELDKLIRKFERSQNFNLVDLGAVMFMGPVGLAVSKGGSYADLLVANYGKTSPITAMKSQLTVEDGIVNLMDLAFATEENRVAAKGLVNTVSDSLDITFAVVDENGCSIIEQRLYGSLDEPERSRIRFLETILAPLTNLLQAAAGRDCDPFYQGSVPHPVKK